jgi:hypothetical protein
MVSIWKILSKLFRLGKMKINFKPKEEEGGETKQQDQSQEVDESEEQQVNLFLGYFFGLGEEEGVEEVHMSQNVVTTRSASKATSSNPHESSDTTKTTPNTQKNLVATKQSTPSTPPTKLDYDLLEDLKRD